MASGVLGGLGGKGEAAKATPQGASADDHKVEERTRVMGHNAISLNCRLTQLRFSVPFLYN